MVFSLFAPSLALAPDAAPAPGEAALRLARHLFSSSPELARTTLISVLIAGIFIQILAYWIAARIVVGNENATFGRAAYLWFLSLLTGIGLAILLVVCISLAATTQQSVMIMLVAGGWLLLAFTIGLLLPAKVFQTDLLRSLGILILAGILVLAGQTALDQVLGRSPAARWKPWQRLIFASNESRQRRLKHLINGDQLATIEADLDHLSRPEERRKSFHDRQASLRTVFAALEQRRRAIKPGDQEALTAYEASRVRYEELVKLMRADYAASQAPQPSGTPAAR